MFLLRLALLLASSLGAATLPHVALAQQDPLQRLAHPEVAQRLGLTDPQRASLQQLLLERSQLDSLADPTQRKTQLQENSTKLLAVLNEEQKQLWKNDGPGKLKFQFRDMEWDAVLDWFARQEALTLVMDRTPPGTFTYSDHREYSSAEAVDLLNSVLLTRGFTLVRREKMLIVFELSDAIPIELIPRISLEDLPARGKFELVSILFPLGTRPIDDVIKEVTPYLGKYGRAIPLAQSRQLLVVENAGKMQTINVLIATVPEPKAPQPKPDPPPPPQPVFASYSIGNLDPDATLKAIKTLVPSEQITVDGKTRILNANVVPASQAAIEAALAKMVSEQSAAPPQVSRAFPIGTNDAVSLATQIRALAPQATVAGEKGSTQILVSATEADMKRISEAMNSMGITSSATDKSLRSFPLERKPTDAWLAMVKAMIPQASVWLDADKKRISVLANEEDLKLVGRLIPELIAALPSEATRTLKAYRVTDEQKQRYLALAPNLTDLASMKVIDPTKAGELLVWGLPEEHLLLDQVLTQLGTSDPNAPSELRRYDLSKSELAQLTLLKPEIEKRIAPTQLIMDTAGTGFWAWGNPDQHATLKAALSPLRKPTAALLSYKVSDEQKRRFTLLLPTLTDLASLKVIDASQPGELMLWGTSEEQDLASKLLDQLALGNANSDSELRRYDLSKSEMAQLTLLKPEIEKRISPMQLILDTAGNGFWAWGNAKQHETLQASLTPLRKNNPALRAYSVNDEQKRRFTLLLPTLTDLASLKVIDASQPGELMLWGTSEEQDLASKLLDQLALGNPNGDSELRRYDLSKSEIAQLTLLKPEIEKRISPMQLILDTAGNGFWAWGSAKQHETLQASLSPLRKLVPSLQSYKVSDEQKRRFTLLLPTLTDLASLRVVDATQPGQLILWASTDEHTIVAKLLEQLALGDSNSESILQRYEIPKNQLPQFTLLKPEIDKRVAPLQVTLDPATGTIWGWGSRELHAKLADALAPLQQPAGPSKQEVVIAYPLQHADPVTLKPVLAEIHKDVNVVADSKRKMLIVTGNVEQQARLQNAIQQLDQPPTSSSQEEIHAYDLRGLQAASVLPTLQLMWPDLKFTSDPTANKLIASGSSRDHQALQKAIDQLLEPADGQTMEVKTYPVPFGEVTTLNAVILQLAPKSVTSPDLVNRTITAWATTEQHQRIQQALEQLSQTAQGRQELITYKVPPERALAIKTSLATLFPTTGIAADAASGQITVLAPKELQTKIAEVIENAKQPKSADEERVPIRYEVPLSLRSSFAPLLTQAFPAATVATPPTDLVSPLVVLATKAEHEKIAALVEELRTQVDSATALNANHQLRIFPIDISVTDATSVMNALKAAMPADVLVQANPTTNSVIVSGPPDLLDRAAQLVTSLQAHKELVAYKVPIERTLAIKTSLATLFPTTSIAADPISGQIMVVASKELQSKIADAIEKSNQPKSPDEERTPIRYEVPPTLRSSFAPLLTQAFPAATVATPPTDLVSPLVVLATKDEHEKIAALVEELRAQVDSATALNAKHELRIFPIDISVTDATSVMNALKAAMPADVLVQANPTTNSVIVSGPLEQLDRAAQLVTSLQARKEFVAYKVPIERTLAIKTSLATLFPTTSIAADPISGQIMVVASKELQTKIADAIEKSNQPKSPDEERIPIRYEVPPSLRSSFAPLITQAFPAASVVTPPTDLVSPLVVLATQAEHEKIAALAEELRAQVESAVALNAKHELRIFPIDISVTDATSVMNALKAAMPTDVLVQANATTNSVIVTGPPEQLDRASQLVQGLQEAAASTIKSTRVYPLRFADPLAAARVLTPSLPRATVVGDVATKTVAVTGNANEHDRVAEFMKAFDVATSTDRSTQVYRVGLTNATTLASALQLMLPQASVQADAASGAIIVTANPQEHERVKTVVTQLDHRGDSPMITKSYALRHADPTAASRALATSFPKAIFAPDATNGGLFVTATDPEHAEIDKLVQEMNSQSLRKPTLQTYSLKKTSATVVGTALQKALLRSLTASVSFDDASATIFVVGTPDDQSVAKQLIDTLDAPDASRESRQLKLFSLTGVDGLSATATIKALFENEKPTIDVRYDSTKGQLVVLGSPKQLEAVEKTLAEFAPPERKLEIISLRANEPSAVRSAIQSLFTDTSYAESPNVNVDEAKQQLIIRATPEQWTQIRNLLQQMGEPTTNDSANLTTSTQRVRTLAAPQDPTRVLERIQKIWPSIRSNRLEVFQPNQLEPANIPNQPHGPYQPPQESNQPPVIIIPGEQRWTIASDDPEALTELEKLLASNGIQSASPIISTGNYSLYLLEHAGASTIATLLSDLLNKGSSSTSTSSLLGKVKVVADARINAIIVYGTRTERQVIEQLLGVLDSDAMQDSLQSLLPQIVAIENTNAKRVYDSIRDIYKNQLASDGGRRPLPIPEGIAPGVALLMQQINAAAAGPLLTVSLDAMTNSLLVRAPRELSSEVVQFIHLMDRQASENMTTRIDVIPLQHSNVARIRKALDLLILGK